MYHLRRGKRKRRNRADPLCQKLYPYVIEFSPSPVVVVFVSGDWMDRYFSGCAVLQLLCPTIQMHYKYSLEPFCPIDFFCVRLVQRSSDLKNPMLHADTYRIGLYQF